MAATPKACLAVWAALAIQAEAFAFVSPVNPLSATRPAGADARAVYSSSAVSSGSSRRESALYMSEGARKKVWSVFSCGPLVQAVSMASAGTVEAAPCFPWCPGGFFRFLDFYATERRQ